MLLKGWSIGIENNHLKISKTEISMKKLGLSILLFSLPLITNAHEFLAEILIQQDESKSEHLISAGNHQLSSSDIYNIYKREHQINVTLQRKSEDNNQKSLFKFQQVPKCPYDNATCGQFDPFSMARLAAITTCHEKANASPELYPNGLIPQFIGPSSFVSAGSASSNHHDNYTLNDGLNFNCVYLSNLFVL